MILSSRQWPEVYDSCHTFLDVARVKQHTAMRESHAFHTRPCDSRMAVCCLTRATSKNVRQNLIPRATAYCPVTKKLTFSSAAETKSKCLIKLILEILFKYIVFLFTLGVEGCLVLVGKEIELDAVGRQFEPHPFGVTWDAVHEQLWY